MSEEMMVDFKPMGGPRGGMGGPRGGMGGMQRGGGMMPGRGGPRRFEDNMDGPGPKRGRRF